MIRAMSLTEMATAMGKTDDEFRTILPALTVLGFPPPVTPNGGFETAEVLNWVVKQQDWNLAIISQLANRLRSMP